MITENDKKIIELIQDDKHFDEGISLLIKTYQKPLYSHVRRFVNQHADADDILQNVFIKVFKYIKGFREESKLYTWLYRIATNEATSYVKKQKRNTSIDEVHGSSALSMKADGYIDGDATQRLLKSALDILPEKQKVVFCLRYYDEMNYKEMSKVLETSVGALKASYHHAVRKVEAYLKQNLELN